MNKIRAKLRQKKGLTLVYIICVMALIVAMCFSVIYAGSQTYLAAVNRVETIQVQQQAKTLTQTLVEQLTAPVVEGESLTGIQAYLSTTFPNLAAPGGDEYNATGACIPVTFEMSAPDDQYGSATVVFQRIDQLVTGEDGTTTAIRGTSDSVFVDAADGSIDYRYLAGGYFTLKMTVTVEKDNCSAQVTAYLDATQTKKAQYQIQRTSGGETTTTELRLVYDTDGYLLIDDSTGVKWPIGSCFIGGTTTGQTGDDLQNNFSYTFKVSPADGNEGCVYELERYE